MYAWLIMYVIRLRALYILWIYFRKHSVSVEFQISVLFILCSHFTRLKIILSFTNHWMYRLSRPKVLRIHIHRICPRHRGSATYVYASKLDSHMVQVITCCLFGAKPLSEQNWPSVYDRIPGMYSKEIRIRTKQFWFNWVWKCLPHNGRHIFSGTHCVKKCLYSTADKIKYIQDTNGTNRSLFRSGYWTNYAWTL